MVDSRGKRSAGRAAGVGEELGVVVRRAALGAREQRVDAVKDRLHLRGGEVSIFVRCGSWIVRREEDGAEEIE